MAKEGTIKRVCIRDLGSFESTVFGAECFLKNYPELHTVGVEVRKYDRQWFIIKDEKVVHDTAFFTWDEIQRTMKVIK
jgi:hypothetical protein